MRRLFAIVVLVVVVPLGAYLFVLSRQIERQSSIDEAQQADVIIVLGAAEYNGRPSPVLKARLDHAYELYTRKLAPLVLTTGGAGGDPRFTEGEVGRDYLIKRGIPSENLAVEGEGDSTMYTITAVSEIMRRMGLATAILVSDGYHIFRAKRILEHQGMRVYGSPRPHTPKGTWRESWLYMRQAVGYTLWRVGVNI
jgi:uncharacterized SAM-binding protein YcdF (DUF218 family)